MVDYPEMMTAEQAAEFLQMNREVLYRRLRNGQLPGLRVGHEWRIPKSELIARARENVEKKGGKA